ncbi:MAG: TetR/AcrR family transcriptional regulator [Spirochaetes bacterium]|jgi:AcrR family transcriptional regulator|nr:TetR/AcrR family transcriptional regulator [Spirochaetota bacterium]
MSIIQDKPTLFLTLSRLCVFISFMLAKNKKNTSYHHGDLKETLINQSLSIIDKEGLGGLTLRKAARLAGVSHAAPAHHFGDMKGLLAAIATNGFVLLTTQMVNSIDQLKENNPLYKFKTIGLAYIEFALKNPSFLKIMYHSELSDKKSYPELMRESKKPFQLLKNIIMECQKEKLIKDGNLDESALFAWSTVHGFSNLAVNDQLKSKGLKKNKMEYADKITNLLYTGLKINN